MESRNGRSDLFVGRADRFKTHLQGELMARKFRGPKIVKEIDDAMNKGLARFVILTQSKLSAANPVDTGRMASSWFIGEGTPSREVAPERDGPGSVKITPYNGPITMKSSWWISNSLPYAERVAFDPMFSKNGRRGGADWFTRIQNSQPKDAERAFDYFLRKVK